MRPLALLLLPLALWTSSVLSDGVGINQIIPPDDQDASGDDLEFSGSGSGDIAFVTADIDVQQFNITPSSPAPESTQAPQNTTGSQYFGGWENSVSLFETTVTTISTTLAAATTIQVPVVPENPAEVTTPVLATTPAPVTTLPFGEGDLDITTITLTSTSSVSGVDVVVPQDLTTFVPPAGEGDPVVTTKSSPVVTHVDSSDVEDWDTPLTTTLLITDEDDYMFNTINEEVIRKESLPDVRGEIDSDITLEEENKDVENNGELGASSGNQSLLERTEVLAGVVAGGVVGLAFAVMLVSLMIYRMKKKDEGSYALDEQKQANGGYQKPQRQEEFLA